MSTSQIELQDPSPEHNWAKAVVSEAFISESLTVGIPCASRSANDQRTVHMLMAALAQESLEHDSHRRLLHIRLSEDRDPHAMSSQRIPVAQRSPLGPWSTVTIPVNKGTKPTWEQEQLTEWLPLWKEAFQLIVIDLGPVSTSYSRAIGRLCDGCYLLLGPEPCGSQQWILRQISQHQHAGSIICGSLLATSKAA